MRVKVYIAGPVSSDPIMGARDALNIANRLLDVGFIPFVPHLCVFWHFLHPRKYREWMSYSAEWMKACDCVLRLLGESRGADHEVALAAQLGIPVFFTLEDLLMHGRELSKAAQPKQEPGQGERILTSAVGPHTPVHTSGVLTGTSGPVIFPDKESLDHPEQS